MGSAALALRFGRNLGRHRRLADLSQRELGELTGLHKMDIGAIERGERLPRIDTILKVSAGVEASPCELMAGLRWYPGRQIHIEGEFRVEDHSPSSSAAGERKARKA
jgi:transcriptional regulator with XRE-family HTH domain